MNEFDPFLSNYSPPNNKESFLKYINKTPDDLLQNIQSSKQNSMKMANHIEIDSDMSSNLPGKTQINIEMILLLLKKDKLTATKMQDQKFLILELEINQGYHNNKTNQEFIIQLLPPINKQNFDTTDYEEEYQLAYDLGKAQQTLKRYEQFRQRAITDSVLQSSTTPQTDNPLIRIENKRKKLDQEYLGSNFKDNYIARLNDEQYQYNLELKDLILQKEVLQQQLIKLEDFKAPYPNNILMKKQVIQTVKLNQNYYVENSDMSQQQTIRTGEHNVNLELNLDLKMQMYKNQIKIDELQQKVIHLRKRLQQNNELDYQDEPSHVSPNVKSFHYKEKFNPNQTLNGFNTPQTGKFKQIHPQNKITLNRSSTAKHTSRSIQQKKEDISFKVPNNHNSLHHLNSSNSTNAQTLPTLQNKLSVNNELTQSSLVPPLNFNQDKIPLSLEQQRQLLMDIEKKKLQSRFDEDLINSRIKIDQYLLEENKNNHNL
ncbi:UNKNOWN [Stylonychia lemnae]|uniref:Uncharacterized protein n=1 Tax=Stylonychia lemnae TaxID=5949 RepID=A0A078B7W7_STYLE|nr:UNKNOWN [Stylonychia lemnae]|eukprot:CDW90615.1 UNKNOWN [Stylonychia lemnae]